jgi:3-hydroxyisobutyrate dehydrogenase-like beta-hydroxyacid dehydrogenase
MTPTTPKQWTIGLVGYGEVGRILAEDLRKQDMTVVAYDIKLGGNKGGALREHAWDHGVALTASHADLAARADFIVSAVTASQAVPVAQACAPAVKASAFFLDFNSASPGAKQRAAKLIEAAGGRYRSILIKGLEAMTIECFTTARAYGVEDAVLASFRETFPGIDWEKQGAYFFQRVIEHGRRRAEEVREVAETMREIGLTPWSAQGTAERQAFIADLADDGAFGTKGTTAFARSPDWRTEADRILAAVKAKKKAS